MAQTHMPMHRLSPFLPFFALLLCATLLLGAAQAQEDLLLPPPDVAATAAPSESAPTDAEQVVDVRIVGNDTIAPDQISQHINTRVGRPYDWSVLQRDVRRLANLGWFVDVKPLQERTAAGRVVIFQVVERPTTRYVTFLGNDRVSDKKLAKQTGLKVGGAVDPYAAEEGRRKIRDFYKGKGYNNVQVSVYEGTKPTDQGVVYLINEGTSERIWTVDFVGNEFASDGRLKNFIKSKPPLLKLFKGYLDRDKIATDVEQLTAYYRAYGFFQARIGRKLDYNEEGDWATLTFAINEGPRFKVRNVSFQGVTKFKEEDLDGNVQLRDNQLFEQAKMRKDSLWLQELYGSNGYVFADVKPETVFLEEPGAVDLVYKVDEGGQFRVGRVFVHIGGDNPHTRIQTALNRLSLRPGDIMDTRELKASQRRLRASQLFEADAATGVSPKITYRIPDDAEFGLAERPTGKVRGQSPAPVGPLVLAPPSFRQVALTRPAALQSDTMHRRIARFSPGRDDMEVHVYCDDLEHFQRWQELKDGATDSGNRASQPSHADGMSSDQQDSAPETVIRGQSPQPQTTDTMQLLERRFQRPGQPPTAQPLSGQPLAGQRGIHPSTQSVVPHATYSNPYQNAYQTPQGAYASVRGQSPQGPQQAYAQVNAQPEATTTQGLPYGGQVVRATGPNQVGPGQVQPVQYSAQTQPPAGAVAPLPLDNQGQLPSYQVFPDGRFGLPGEPYPTQTVDIFVNGNETQTGRLMVGVGVTSDAGVVGNISIDERNFNWRRFPRSFEDIRNGQAFRGDGQRFRIDASPGSQLHRYLVSWQEPYLFDRPISLGLSGSYFDRNYRDWQEQRLGGRISLGKQWVDRDLSANISYRGENVKLFNPRIPTQTDLAEAAGSNSLHGFKLTVTNDTRDSAFLATSGHYIELSGEQVIGTFDYPRFMADLREYWLLYERPDHSGRHVLSYSTNIGYSGTHTPIYEHFFAGGFATMRGFDFRGASPVDVANGNVEVGGHFQWLSSVQYIFPITADEMVHGVAFCDFGTVEKDIEIEDFRVAPGFGLRIAVPAMGPAPIALDFAFPVSHADFDDREVFSFSLGFGRG